ncbi:MAG TPA: hypothetical protein VHS79_04020 [Actinomycetes bacterium]|nr:hypothetical protein [Actinomycetota bacterium]HEX2156140.1 hypothetical protein [Actinomycetes bacterium]
MVAAGGGPAGGRLRGTGPARLAWGVLGCSLLLVLAATGLRVLGPEAGAYPFWGEVTVIVVVLGTLGALVAARRPEHPVGWLFVGIGLAGAVQLVAGNYAMAARADPALPGGDIAAVAAEELRIAGLGMVTAVMLLFPTGRLPSPRWRPMAWAGAAGLLGHLAAEGLTPGRGEQLLGYENPFGLEGRTGLLRLLGALEGLFLLAVLAAIGSLVVRFRRARGVERQQLKWFVYTAVVALAVLVAASVALADLMEHGPLGSILWGATPVALAAAVAVAVLRYRLYEIDRLVNRTLVYGLLTVLLGAVYAAGVFAAGRLLDPADGQSELAVAASTLAVAALFQPARRRVQELVDRRFDRRRYDGARTVAAFSARMRDELDLDTLSSELLAVVDRTVQPSGMSLWLRPGSDRP